VTDRQTDGHRVPAIAALCIASHGKNRTLAVDMTYLHELTIFTILHSYFGVDMDVIQFSTEYGKTFFKLA